MKAPKVDDIQLYINGQFVGAKAGGSFANVNPFTNQILNQVAAGESADIDRAVAAAVRAFRDGPWGQMKLTERLSFLRKIADRIDFYADELSYLESIDTGLPVSQTKKMAARAAQNFRFYAEIVASRMVGESYQVDQSFLNYTIRKPLGVAGLITPWNAPFMLETWKVAPALATGNTVVLKPAEWSPLTANKLAEIIDEVGLPSGVFNVVHGLGETAGAALVAHPDVPLISFTGETVTGSEIMRNGSTHLKRISMELGGKSPIIVFADADLERALDACIWGIYSFNGERCTANSRLFIQKRIYHSFIEKLIERIHHLVVGDPLDPTTEVGPLIHSVHAKRVRQYLEIAKLEGAQVISANLNPSLPKHNFVTPTLLTGVHNQMRVAQEEIFGPVLAAMPFESETEVIQVANQIRYGLAGYVWTSDLSRAHRVAQSIDAGMIWINSQNTRDLRIPFGGMKQSGMGREGGHYAFDFYTETQVIHTALGDHSIPPFGKKSR